MGALQVYGHGCTVDAEKLPISSLGEQDMKHQSMRQIITLLCLLLAPATLGDKVWADSKIYLVRHAEKVADGSRDPALTKEGQARANWLATYFKGKSLDTIFSTDYRRTRATAMPTADEHNLSLILYDPRTLEDFAETLKGRKGQTLIVGHSNTTPVLAGLLIGEEFEELDERVYDHIYVVSIADDGTASLSIEYSEPRTVLEVTELKSSIEARLAVMAEVAHYKWAQKLAIEAPEREEAILRSTAMQAVELGLGAGEAEMAVKAQMKASKLVQSAQFKAWKNSPPTGPVPDLEGNLRPKISKLTEAFLKSLKAAKPYLSSCHTAAALSRTDMATPDVWHAATSALLPEGGCP